MASIATSVTKDGGYTTTYLGGSRDSDHGMTFVIYLWDANGSLKDSVQIQFPTQEAYQAFVTSVIFPQNA